MRRAIPLYARAAFADRVIQIGVTQLILGPWVPPNIQVTGRGSSATWSTQSLPAAAVRCTVRFGSVLGAEPFRVRLDEFPPDGRGDAYPARLVQQPVPRNARVGHQHRWSPTGRTRTVSRSRSRTTRAKFS